MGLKAISVPLSVVSALLSAALSLPSRNRRCRNAFRSLSSQGKGFEPTGTQHSCFGNCAELSLNVIKGGLDCCCVGVQPKRSIRSDAGRDRCLLVGAVLPEGIAEPSGFLT